VTKLAAFERFVFVILILERYSNWDCSLLLECNMNKVTQARQPRIVEIDFQVGLLKTKENLEHVGNPERRRC
jgi:hypothetical protein